MKLIAVADLTLRDRITLLTGNGQDTGTVVELIRLGYTDSDKTRIALRLDDTSRLVIDRRPSDLIHLAPPASVPVPKCRCGCPESAHQGAEGLGGAQCTRCPGDSEQSWRHPYTPEETL